ncbi:vitelline B precursor protein [Clonorchis sinensis]|uniref:Vitelline B protein n=1 Tax=Clonorchis sinensis TaxID=79923 RepID=H2KQ56_CLOSI|nr:vitelline B precursor protein [Clonorchis sinensis]
MWCFIQSNIRMRSALLTLACVVYAGAVQYQPYVTTLQSVTGLNDAQNAYTVVGGYGNNIAYDTNYGTQYKDVVDLLSGYGTDDSSDYSSAYDTGDTYDAASDYASSSDYELVDDTYTPSYDTYSASSSTTDDDYEVISYQPEDKYGTYTKYDSYGTDLSDGYGAYDAYDTDYSDGTEYGVGDYGSDYQTTLSNEDYYDVDKSTNYDNPITPYVGSDYENYQPYVQYYDDTSDNYKGVESDPGISIYADYNRHGDTNNYDTVDYEVHNPPVTYEPVAKRHPNHQRATKSHDRVHVHNEQAVVHKLRSPGKTHHLNFASNGDGIRYNSYAHNDDHNLNGYEVLDKKVNVHGLRKPIPVRIKQNVKQKRMIYHDKYEKELLDHNGYKPTYGRDGSKFFDRHAASRYSDVKYQSEYGPRKHKPVGYSPIKYDTHNNLYDIHPDIYAPKKHFDKADHLEHHRKRVKYSSLENEGRVEGERNDVPEERDDSSTKANGDDDVKVVQDDIHDFEADLIARGKVLGYGSSRKGTRFEQITTFHHGGSLDPSGEHMKRYGGFSTKGALKNYGEEFAHLKHGLIGDLKAAGRFDGLADDDAKRQFALTTKHAKYEDDHDYGKYRGHGNRKGHGKIRFRGKSHKNGEYHVEY